MTIWIVNHIEGGLSSRFGGRFERYSQVRGSMLIFPITFLVFMAWVLLAAELGIARGVEKNYLRYWDRFPGGVSDGSEHPSYPDIWRWTSNRNDPANGGTMFGIRTFALLVDTVHLPIHHILIHKQKLTSSGALGTSVFMSMAWMASFAMTAVHLATNLDYSRVGDPQTVYGLGIGSVLFQCLITIFYVMYMGYSAAAVQRQRKRGNGPIEKSPPLNTTGRL